MILFDNEQVNYILGSPNPEVNLMALLVQTISGLKEDNKETNEVLQNISSSLENIDASLKSLSLEMEGNR